MKIAGDNVDMNAIEEYRKLEKECRERINDFEVATQKEMKCAMFMSN